MDLLSIFKQEPTSIHKWMHYFPIYERYFSHRRNSPIVFLEIGVQKGGSLKMWKQYFHPQSRVVGIDIDPDCQQHDTAETPVRIGSQADTELLQRVIDEFGVPDIVLDDGSHNAQDQRATFEFLYPKMADNSCYLVEDTHTSYYPWHGGGLNEPNSWHNYAKRLIDEMHSEYTNGLVPATHVSTSTAAISFYANLVAIEKQPWTPREAKINKEL